MLELEMTLNCPKHVTSQCPILFLFKILLCYWCCCWVCLQSVDKIVGRVALCDLSCPISCWQPACWPGLSVCDADWLAYLSICTHLVWVCLCTRALNAREKVGSQASSQLALHVIISLLQHNARWSPELFWTVDQGHHWRKFCASPILIRNSVDCPQDFYMSINSKHGDHTAWGGPYR